MNVSCSMSAYKDSLDTALAAIAREGFSHVDLIAIPGWGLVEPAELVTDFDSVALRVRAALKHYGLRVSALNAAVANLYGRADAAVNVARLEQVDAICRLMAQVQAPLVSFFPGGNWPAQQMRWEEVLAAEVATLREMFSVGMRYGVAICVEPHAHTPFENLQQVRALLDAMPELRVAYDPSHFAMQSLDLRQTAFILDRATHVHVRDAAPGAMQTPVGQGTVDTGWLVEQLRLRQYQGAIAIEYLPGMGDQIAPMKQLLESAMRRE